MQKKADNEERKRELINVFYFLKNTKNSLLCFLAQHDGFSSWRCNLFRILLTGMGYLFYLHPRRVPSVWK